MAAKVAFSYVIISMLVAALAVSLVSRDGGPMISTAEAAPPTLAILPLAALGTGAVGTGFVEGLDDDLLTVVSRVSDLRVISRTSVLRYGSGEQTIPEIGRAMGVKAILEGSVQVAGDRIRVNVQLIDATWHRWRAMRASMPCASASAVGCMVCAMILTPSTSSRRQSKRPEALSLGGPPVGGSLLAKGRARRSIRPQAASHRRSRIQARLVF